MCHVQRVTNTCGHINDHVLMACHIAKTRAPSPEHCPTSSTIFAATHGTRTSTTQSQNQNQTQSQCEGYSFHFTETTQERRNGEQVEEEEEDMIQRSGFDARTRPYCKAKHTKMLDSPKGFKCMVSWCGRAD
ncbi:hypothetical protein BDW62DRAFT_203769 [Aspergillus aurantiobrunneus]